MKINMNSLFVVRYLAFSQTCGGRPTPPTIKIRHSDFKFKFFIDQVFVAHRVMWKELKNEKERAIMTLGKEKNNTRKY